MKKISEDDIAEHWDKLAHDWRIHVGREGDNNRVLNSDPVLWELLGNVGGKTVLDAGCGTGYLANLLMDRGATVIGADLSKEMIKLARQSYPTGDFRIESCSRLSTVRDSSVDLIVSNYVLMDVPDLPRTVEAFFRVLKPGGHAVVIFSHPCFPQGNATLNDGKGISYNWNHSYFEEVRIIDKPWGRFKTHFTWFHRPLSDYWRAFSDKGFTVTELREPRMAPERIEEAPDEKTLRNSLTRPYSIAFKLVK